MDRELVLVLWDESPSGTSFVKASWVKARYSGDGKVPSLRKILGVVKAAKAAALVAATGAVPLSEADKVQVLARMCELTGKTPVGVGRGLVESYLDSYPDEHPKTVAWLTKTGRRLGLRVSRAPAATDGEASTASMTGQ